MGTSNWQNIPFCVETLMKIAPQRVLDIGVGFGRWGIIVREFCDVWYGRVLQKDWQVHIEGIEGFAENIVDYHQQFYDKVHIGDANELLPPLLKSGWDVVIFGDVLEHFTKEAGRTLLEASLAASTYVLVNIPLDDEWPQEDIYDNIYERHLSVWSAADFEAFHLKRAAFFNDFMGRPFGSFILSHSDPHNLQIALFSKSTDFSQTDVQPAAEQLTPAQRQLLTEAAQTAQELARVKNTLTWQAYEAIDRSALGPPMRQVMRVVGAPFRRRLTNRGRNDVVNPLSSPPAAPQAAIKTAEPATARHKHAKFSADETAWLAEATQGQPEAIAILHPAWRGIRSATRNLFSTCYFVDDGLNETRAAHLAHLLAESGCERLVFSGFPLTHQHLVTALNKISPRTKLYILWHGNFLQSGEDYAWQGFQLIKDLCQQGLIYKWGFVKKGMAEVVAQLGLRTGFVMNYVDQIPAAPSPPLADGPHLGVWGVEYNWRKTPYAMLAATRLIPGAKVHSSAVKQRTQEFGQVMGIDWAYARDGLIDEPEMATVLAKMHLNIYVTLSECAPMLPLESLSLGVPCLIGPNSHLFEDHDLLRRRLVVPYPDSAATIADYAQAALANRAEIVHHYAEYAPAYNQRAKAALSEFLEV